MRERDIFIEALQKPGRGDRDAYLQEACAGDSDLRSRVERLLLEHDRQESFILDSTATSLQGRLPLDPPLLLTPPGTVIGRYKLLEAIGEGGYGTVFMAEQTSPVQRKVAMKIIKAGMDTRQVIARFEAERQALALMDHENIAKVFDAGTTDTGRPYFVMELVKGTPITKYCDEHRLQPRARLELFVQVCRAVQHAHQKGIIHRDLKPTNVLVAPYDGKPVPKVIDFGVAKATGQRLTDATMFTGFGDIIGTPQYMSPEQAELNQLDVDTRSDIYSLGVLLYELLTGTTPLEGKRVKEAALLEVLRVIREEEPPRPSTRLTATAELPSIAAQRGLEPKSLGGIVKGELDWIVMKALEKDRGRRYETANGLAMDVERYLHDDTVQACPASAGYRFRKFARRHQRSLTTAAVLALVLVVGSAISTWQAFRATTAEALAENRLDSEKRLRADADQSRRDAERQSDLASHERDRARRHLHAAQLNLAAAAAARGDLAETMGILHSQQASGEQGASSKGFGWRYLWARCHEGHLLTLRGEGGPVQSVKFMKDLLVSGSADGSVNVWDTATGKVRSTLRVGGGALCSMAVSPVGSVIAAGTGDGTVSIWNASTGTAMSASQRHQRAVSCVTFSPDGKLIASSDTFMPASLDVVGETVVCETITGHEVARFPEAGSSVAFSPDGSTLALTQHFSGVNLLDAYTGKVRFRLRHRLGVSVAAFSPDGKTLASGAGDGEVRLWDVATGELRKSLRGGSAHPVLSFAFSADGRRLVCGRQDGVIDLWELTAGHRTRTRVHSSSIRSVAFSPDGAIVVTGSDDGAIILWDATFRPEAASTPHSHTGMVWSVTFSPDGSTLASASDDDTIKLWNVASGEVRMTLTGHTGNVIQTAFSTDGRMLASASDDASVRLWDLATGQPHAVLLGGDKGTLAVAFSPDGKSLASAGHGTAIRIWDHVTRSQRSTITVQPDLIWSLAYSGDSKMLASAAMRDGVRMWDPNTGGLLGSIPQGSYFVKFFPDGRALETRGVGAGNVLLWNLGTDKPRVALAGGMVGGIGRNVAFSPDGGTLMLSRSDGIHEIDATTGEERVVLPDVRARRWAIAFSPDGSTVASGSWSGEVRFWRAATEREVIEQSVPMKPAREMPPPSNTHPTTHTTEK